MLNGNYSIVDSGTVMPTLPTLAFEAVRQIFVNNCSKSNLKGVCTGVTAPNATLFDQVCFDLSPQDIAQFPTIDFILQRMLTSTSRLTCSASTAIPVVLHYPPQMYLKYQYFCNPGQIGLGLDHDFDFAIVGAELMVGYNSIFDRANNRIGFAPLSNCP